MLGQMARSWVQKDILLNRWLKIKNQSKQKRNKLKVRVRPQMILLH